MQAGNPESRDAVRETPSEWETTVKIRMFSPRLRFRSQPPEGAPASGTGGGSADTGDGTSGDDSTGDDSDDSDDDSEDDEPLGPAGRKALAAARAKASEATRHAAALQKQIDDSKKTAEEKAADDLAAAQRDAADAHLKALKYEVAAAKGIDLKLAPRLTGATKAELEADADVLMESIPTPTGGTPKPDRSQGGGSGGTDKGASVSAGRDLFAERHPKKQS